MPLRVGFDLDGTVADMNFGLRREAVKLFGESVLRKAVATPDGSNGHTDEADRTRPRANGTSTPKTDDSQTSSGTEDELHLTGRQQVQLWEHVKKVENFWNTLPELETGIISRIQDTARARRWEVIFLTTRPSTAGDLVQLQSQQWLAAHGFEYPSVFVVQHSRGKIADALALDAFVDDRAENCLDIAVESKAKVLLVWHGDLSDVPAAAKRLGVQPVATIFEAIKLLERLDDVRSQPSLRRSIRRAFGRTEPAE